MVKNKILAYNFIAGFILSVLSLGHSAFADVISCPGDFQDCFGTNGDDLIKGTKLGEQINGGSGDDKINGFGGHDQLLGDAGDDVLLGGNDNEHDYLEGRAGDDRLDGGKGDDLILGDDEDGDAGGYGSDILLGGAGDDQLFHSQYIESHGGEPLKSDGNTDKLDCGPGNDEAWINVGTDHDVVKNCEAVHTEND